MTALTMMIVAKDVKLRRGPPLRNKQKRLPVILTLQQGHVLVLPVRDLVFIFRIQVKSAMMWILGTAPPPPNVGLLQNAEILKCVTLKEVKRARVPHKRYVMGKGYVVLYITKMFV
jgi:hypothetical protein